MTKIITAKINKSEVCPVSLEVGRLDEIAINKVVRNNKVSLQQIFILSSKHEDIKLARHLQIQAIFIGCLSEKTKYLPDIVVNSEDDIDIKLNRASVILFDELNIKNYSRQKELSKEEKYILQNHFRRIQQHSMVAGKFLAKQAVVLKQDTKLWEKTGEFHDIDYARVYLNMGKHGFLGGDILASYGYPQKLVNAVTYHNNLKFKDSNDYLERAVFISGRFLKQMVHSFRRFNLNSIQEVTSKHLDHVYNSDCRRNETLTHFEIASPPESFSDFHKWMNQHTEANSDYAISREKLLQLAKEAFWEIGTRPMKISNGDEIENLEL